VGSRVHGAASACLVAAGLFLCGLGGALALAEPSSPSDLPPGTHSDDVHGKGPQGDSDGSGGSATKTNEKPGTETGEPKTETDKSGNGDNNNGDNGVGNPGCGNNGNSGGNGNAGGCGSSTPPPSSSPTTAPPTTTDPTTTTHTTTTTTHTTTTSKTTTTSDETTTSTSTSGVGLPGTGGGGGGGGGAVEVPSGRPEVPDMQLPPASEPSVIDVVPGVGAAAADLPIPPITLPVIVAPAVPLGAGGGAGGSAEPALPAAPRGVSAEPPAGREPLPASVGSNVALPGSSYRVGYADYLRNAGLSQVAALAVPGVTGMLVLTGAGGLVGYRQAKAGHAIHTSGTARFVN
jgi:hypothetical protein